MNRKTIAYLFFVVLAAVLTSMSGCKKNPPEDNPAGPPTHPFPKPVVQGFGTFPDFPDNPMTVEGVDLGRHLFYDSVLSRNYTVSCASCHKQKNGFADAGNGRSNGVHGGKTSVNSMALFNLAYDKGPFFWDGRARTLEEQVVQPVFNPVEMDLPWSEAIERLKARPDYVDKFNNAFGPGNIDQDHAGKALAQFLRSIVSGNTRFDIYHNSGRTANVLTAQEKKGLDLFENDPVLQLGSRKKITGSGVDCGHCHTYPLFMPEPILPVMMNNGVKGDDGIARPIKTPTLRNLAFTYPFMHTGKFFTLDSVINHYDHGVEYTKALDPNMYIKIRTRGNPDNMELDESEKKALKAFLLTLTDSSLITNPAYSSPFRK